MFIRIGYELVFNVPSPVETLMVLFTHPQQAHLLRNPEYLQIEPGVPVNTYVDGFGNRVGRAVLPAGQVRLYYDNVVQDGGELEPTVDGALLHRVEDLPPECMQFLLGSRYCEVDRMVDIAWGLFGNTPVGWQRVKAIVDWVHNNVKFGYQFARSNKTAYDVYVERQGVCRDFQHLAITFLRCMNIPARYATGYLGDIGVPRNPAPMDFSAWFEVYMSGRWITQDARHNRQRIGRVLQARGRDAVDVALTTSFGPTTLQKFLVWTDELK